MRRINVLLVVFLVCSLLLSSCVEGIDTAEATPENGQGVGLRLDYQKRCAVGDIIKIEATLINNTGGERASSLGANSRHFSVGFIGEAANVGEDVEHFCGSFSDEYSVTVYMYLNNKYNGTKGVVKFYTVSETVDESEDVSVAIYLYYEVKDGYVSFGETNLQAKRRL